MYFKTYIKNLFLWTFNVFKTKTHTQYNTHNDDLAVQKANNERGERSLLCPGVSLYHRDLKGERIGAGTGFLRDTLCFSFSIFQVIDFRAFQAIRLALCHFIYFVSYSIVFTF